LTPCEEENSNLKSAVPKPIELKPETLAPPENNEAVDATKQPRKKKVKRNVESRDAWTQTERSDYMMIKQRQKHKEILELTRHKQLPNGLTPQQIATTMLQSTATSASHSTTS
jgi:hypothetical protein